MSSYIRPEILAMHGYVPGEQPQEGGIIKLNTNENPYPSSPAVQRAIGKAIQMGLQKYPDPMASAFRQRAAQLLDVEPNWILCGNGSDDILTIATRAFVGQGDLLRLPYPSYTLYKALAQLQGAAAEEIHFQTDWSLADDFSQPKARLKLAYLPNPNSPSGTMISPERIRDIAAKLPCPLVVDEAYIDFSDTSCAALVKETDKIMVTRSLSKSYALAGLRFGYIVAQPHITEQLEKVKDSYNCDALSIAGATAAIDDQSWLKDNQSKVRASRERLTAGMRALGFATVDSQANFVWNPHHSVRVKPLYEQLKAKGVLVRYMDYPGWGDGLRVSVGTGEQIEKCLGLLRGMV
jgi:histidinol-phosphate aminotransferase